MHEDVFRFNINNFNNRKRLMMDKLRNAIHTGDVDEDILPHLEILNSFPFCFTTSSCSGRIALIDAPLIGPKRESFKVHRWHSPTDFATICRVIDKYSPRHILWLKYDSFIISFSVSSLSWAAFFIRLARYINLKDSGIRSINPKAGYVNMDFMSTEKISVPVKTRTKKLLNYDDLKHIINIALFLMLKNKIKLSLLYECLEKISGFIKKNPESIPDLHIFDPILDRYRQKLEGLRTNTLFMMYNG